MLLRNFHQETKKEKSAKQITSISSVWVHDARITWSGETVNFYELDSLLHTNFTNKDVIFPAQSMIKIVCISKPGHTSYIEAKTFRPISLISFFMKIRYCLVYNIEKAETLTTSTRYIVWYRECIWQYFLWISANEQGTNSVLIKWIKLKTEQKM